MTGSSPGSWLHYPSRSSARTYARSIGAVRAIQGAWTSGDVAGLSPLLHEDAQLVVDTGGRVTAPESARGRASAVQALARVLGGPGVATTTVHSVNGSAGLALRDADSRVVGIITVAVRRRVVSRIWIVLNPDKLRHWN
jgi:RNA polymerase sigma-70 factor (ECF subfamily)